MENDPGLTVRGFVLWFANVVADKEFEKSRIYSENPHEEVAKIPSD